MKLRFILKQNYCTGCNNCDLIRIRAHDKLEITTELEQFCMIRVLIFKGCQFHSFWGFIYDQSFHTIGLVILNDTVWFLKLNFLRSVIPEWFETSDIEYYSITFHSWQSGGFQTKICCRQKKVENPWI